MIDAGIFDSDTPVELIEGFLLERMPRTPPHACVTDDVRSALDTILPPGWCTRAQNPITLSDSEPELDVVIARGTRRDYAIRHPGPAGLALVVEVADATLSRDRGTKQRIYARASIPVYWIVDLVNRRVEVRTDPQGDTYRTLTVLSAGDALSVVIDGVEVATIQVSSLLP